MTSQSRHVSTTIDRPAGDVYDYASNPANLPAWAPGLTNSVELVDGRWTAESPMGRIVIAVAPRNEFGVLDHDVTVASGETFHNPMRVIGNGEGCDVVFTVRRQAGMTDDEFARDAGLVQADLERLKQVMERQ
ncbi:MAG TPA: SRPBCC family protein [Pseudonocardiaceae bacterium]|nr:SRPBCC family protein [Pseudonocardiaceae bacterium]